MNHDLPDLPPLDPALRASLSEPVAPDLDALLGAVLAQVQAPSTPLTRLRELPGLIRLALGSGAALLIVGLATLATSCRPDLARLGPGLPLLIALCGGATLLLVSAALRPMSRRAPDRSVALSWTLAPLLLTALPGLWPGLDPEGGMSFAAHLACLRFGAVVAAATTLVTLALDRSPLPSATRLFSASGAGGFAGLIALALHCPGAQWTHLVVGHGLAGPLVAAALAAILSVLRHRRYGSSTG